MLDELQVDDLKDKVGQFHDKIETQINQLASMREKVSSIKENYDKSLMSCFNSLKILNHYSYKATLNRKHKVISKIQNRNKKKS